MSGRTIDRVSIGGMLVFGLLLCALATALGPASAAEPSSRPTITGTPIVGETLTSSPAGDTGVYRWQRCDPAAATCIDGAKDDPNWSDIPGAEGQNARDYTLTDEDLGKFVRVLAKGTSLGEQFAPSEPVGPVAAGALNAPPQEAPPQEAQQQVVPQHGVQLVGRPAAGIVKFRPPGASSFTALTSTTPIPVNSLIDTRQGNIVLTAATGEYGSQTADQSVEFYYGLFKIKQRAETDAPATAKLAGKLSCGSGRKTAKSEARRSAGPIAVTSARRNRRLWGRGTGSYGTRGRGGTGSVVGTTWFTKDTCEGTLFKVTEGIGINVTPKGSDEEISLGPGERYFAKR